MLISVIIPCYNVDAYIRECVRSVIDQTHTDLEIICVDNGSSDNTHEVLSALQKEHPEKLLLASESKKGAPAARNKGLEMARGEWVQFLDADDLLLPRKIGHQLNLALGAGDIPFIAGACKKQSVDGQYRNVGLPEKDVFKAVFLSNLGNTCSNFFSRNRLKEAGGWNENLKSSQEADLMFRLLKKESRILFDHEPLTIIRERTSGQISKSDPGRNWLQYIELRLEIIEYLKTHKSAYFETNREFYYQKLFLMLRRLSKFDLDRSVLYFEKYFAKDFKPAINPFYNGLFRMLGFRRVQQFF